MQVGAGRLRHAGVGSVADEEVAEAEAVLAHELRLVRADQPFADERGQPGRYLALLGRECLHPTAVEDLALDRPSLDDPPLGRIEPVQAGCEQRLQRGRDAHLAARLARHRRHLLEEERVAAGGPNDLRAQLT